MLTLESISALREQLGQWRRARERLALVPTMGNLHAGHLSLVEEAKRRADRVIVSIFVNPLQFGEGEDFEHYPRTPEEDSRALQGLTVDVLFTPGESELYPAGRRDTARVHVPRLSDILCGALRPGHFDGVATVVAKLFNLVQPDIAVFGKKDYQQLMIIRRMVYELNFPIEIIGVDTVREADGLAMSSRNRYLNGEERKKAVLLHQVLQQVAAGIRSGNKNFEALEEAAIEQLNSAGFRTDYVEIRNADNMEVARQKDARKVVLAASHLGAARLIDNIEILSD